MVITGAVCNGPKDWMPFHNFASFLMCFLLWQVR